MQTLPRYLVTLSLLLLCAGCTASKQEQPLVITVEEYCRVAQAAYQRADIAPLARIATDKELKRVYPTIQALQSTGNIMKSEIDKFQVTSVAPKGANQATVQTAERWSFWWEDQRTGAVTKAKKTEEYRLSYQLLKVGEVWKVDQVRHQ